MNSLNTFLGFEGFLYFYFKSIFRVHTYVYYQSKGQSQNSGLRSNTG
ncbi:hypothetical protein FHS56_001668 [Thermonema lapsum]|uniref:Uncharacterized protein n=1 Tax=Thermonema lapsum TaxID=28195 RepID=A0A846MRR8_9BACT|nr:hypothetical protein [Thermonema lapsum]